MFYGNTVQDTRALFYDSWKKYRNGQKLENLEQQIVAVLTDHPEYQSIIENPTSSINQSFFPELGETNPFLHMGLHLAIRDQIQLDQPCGISEIFNRLTLKLQSRLNAEHALMERFAECLWQAQREQMPPSQQHYLSTCQELLNT